LKIKHIETVRTYTVEGAKTLHEARKAVLSLPENNTFHLDSVREEVEGQWLVVVRYKFERSVSV